MTMPLSIRFPPDVISRLKSRAVAETGANTSALAARLVDEGLRMADHPGVMFKSGPSGRRAALAYGPDIWEVIKFLQEIDERGPAALQAAAEMLNLEVGRVTVAVNYYSEHKDEIDAEITAAEEASVRAERAWLVQQQLIK